MTGWFFLTHFSDLIVVTFDAMFGALVFGPR